jgi:hypothetical protein
MERRVPPIKTELEFKPSDKDRLAEVLGGFSCQNTEGCRIQNCFQDREHIISTNEAQGAEPLSEVEQMLRSHPDFIVDAICRWKHMRINVTWNRSEPISDDFGIGYLLASPLNLNANKRKRLKEIRHGKGSVGR